MIIQANALHIPLKDESVQCVITSPPYWGLRDYGTNGQLGLEKTPEEYEDNTVKWAREVWRVLRNDGTFWLNLGDTYAGYHGNGKVPDDEAPSNKPGYFENMRDSTVVKSKRMPRGSSRWGGGNRPATGYLKPKDLCGMPWKVVFALQADGWYLRSDIIWSKPNPMPESVTDRPTKSHEYLFLLTKRPKYFYDAEAVKEPVTGNAHSRGDGVNPKAAKNSGPNSRIHIDRDPEHVNRANRGIKQNRSFSAAVRSLVNSRNKRTVWTIATQPYPEAHFATFPEKLVEPCIKAGTSEKGACPECGAPWEWVVEKTSMEINRSNNHPPELRTRTSGTMTKPPESKTIGWQPTCKCNIAHSDPTYLPKPLSFVPHEPVPCVVLDIFGGSGTTKNVADRLGRRGVICELKMEYIEMAKKRCESNQASLEL